LLPRAHGRWFLLVSAPIVLIAVAALGLFSRAQPSGATASVASLFPASMRSRPIEARVSGLLWAPFVAEPEATDRSADPKRGDSSDAGRRQQEGLLELLAGDPRDAVAALEKASVSNQPAAWSDLAAAYYEVAVRHDVPECLADALSTADRALTLDPNHVEALFNRALILERLGLRRDSRAAWTRYLAAEPANPWSEEARSHLRALVPRRQFSEVLNGDYDRIGRDPAAAGAIYADDPFGARGQGVVEVLGRWGKAVLRGDERDAVRHLNVARQLGHAVARGGDLTLERSVAVIDGAGNLRAQLAAAHADFYTGMKAFGRSRLDEAEPLLRRAAAVFQQADSPTAIPALLWAANCLYERGHRLDAQKRYEALLAATPAEYPAYRAFMLWQLANCRNARGEWGAAISLFEESATLFAKVGENGNVASVLRLLAALYERTGDPDTAWKNRLASMSGQGIRTMEIDELTVWSIVEAAIVRRDWHMALSFLTVYVDVVKRLDNDIELTTGLLMRAVVRDRLDMRGVQEDIAEARRTFSRVADASYQERLRVAEWRTIGMLRSTPPATADALLTRAIDYESTLGHRSTLPGLLLLRARARRGAENLSGAMKDVELGIQQMEQHRESLPAGAARWGAFYAAEELFEEGVVLALLAGDHESAFRFTEKARARALLDSYAASPDADWRALPPQTVVVEYTTLPDALVIFVADSAGVGAVRTNRPRAALAADADAFTNALKGDDAPEAKRLGASIYRQLIEPIASRLASARNVVFVPDAFTSTIPFGALVDLRGDYFLQHHYIVVAPSASVFIVANAHRSGKAAPLSALIVTAGASTEGTAGLPSVDGEAKRILRNYRKTVRIGEDASQFEDLAESAPAADVIHFGGHAVGDARGYEPASLVLRERGHERRVGVADIAKLRLDRTSVVVLAGCSTASGPRRAAEGVISIAHGFLSAGVPSAIATLWAISDEDAARFFSRLHERLASGMAPANAVRETQLESIRRGDVPPSLWAAVQDIGS